MTACNVLSLQNLLSTIRQRLERAVAGTRLPPWPPTATAASPRASVFLARRFGKALRLMHSIFAFDGVLPRRSVSKAFALWLSVAAALTPYLDLLNVSHGNCTIATAKHMVMTRAPKASRVASALSPWCCCILFSSYVLPL